jgi:DNA processing protein
MFSIEVSAKDFYLGLTAERLKKFVRNPERRRKILENYSKLKTEYIDSVLEKLGVEIIILSDDNYPESLKNIPHTPYILYVRGEIPKWGMFGVVWSRKISSYGKRVITQIVPDISRIFPIVSGGAAGCDTYAHKSALESGNKTVVVIGTGIDETYPVSNEKLFSQIVTAWWAIISIFRVGEPGNPYNFPVRNEIVVWLSRWVLVIEAQKKSGSLITAGLALDLGKDLFAVPWDITSSGSGWTNRLIKKGEAKCVTQSLDVLEEYDVLIRQSAHRKQLPLLDDIESQIYTLISGQDMDIDTLASNLSLNSREVSMKLSLLELKKIIKKDISWKYILI